MALKFTLQFSLLILFSCCLYNKFSMAIGENRTVLSENAKNLMKRQNNSEIMNLQKKLLSMHLHNLRVRSRDYHTAVNYFKENLMNENYIFHIVDAYYTKTGPILRSWRDLNHILFDFILIVCVIYFCIIHLLCNSCIRRSPMLSNPFVIGRRKQDNSEESMMQYMQQEEKQLDQMLQQPRII